MTTMLLGLLLNAVLVVADDEYATDPYLHYRPPFARSLPVQIMLTGVILTLVAVLFIHLMFTAQYHWPLAPVNYVLQLSGVTTLLISLIATIHVVLSATFAESERWPYMFSYIAVNIPPLDMDTNSTDGWTIAERATWLVMNASTSGLIQITHIQFLTLLYPSRLEARLIFFLLGPLAIVAAVMQLLPISSSPSVLDISSAVRNVCNATLSLLFTVALFIWGLLINRKQAWRTDGGTAVFGASALTLALVSTALNFLYVDKEQEYVWLPGLMWAVVLWQSFLGWWWWVGAGSGSGYSGGSGEEGVEGEEKERKRKEAKAKAKAKKQKEKEERRAGKARKVWKGVAGAFSPSSGVNTHGRRGNELRVRRAREEDGEEDADGEGTREGEAERQAPSQVPTSTSRSTNGTTTSVTEATTATTTTSRSRSRSRRRRRRQPTTTTTGTDTNSTTSTTSQQSYSTLPHVLPSFVHRWYASLRREHVMAARQQAAERVERIREMSRDLGEHHHEREIGEEPRRRMRRTAVASPWGFGWGAAAVGVNIGGGGGDVTREERRRREKERRRKEESEGEGEYELDEYVQSDDSERRRRRERRTRRRVTSDEGEGTHSDEVSSEEEGEEEREERPPRRRPRLQFDPSVLERPPRQNQNENESGLPTPVAASTPRPRSLWWWGPLWRWRLKDSTVYR